MKRDEGRVLLMLRDGLKFSNESISSGYDSFVHPLYAIIFSFIDGNTIENSLDRICEYIDIPRDYTKNFILQLIDNEESVGIELNNVFLSFPPKTIISFNSENEKINNYNPDDFLYDSLDLRMKRHLTPTDITLMINNKCATDCVYCYADRRIETNCKIPLNRILEIIKEAKSFGARTFNIIGGEFFIYKYWKEVLEELVKNDFSPFLSTKIPIGETAIKFLADLKIDDLQISLDTLLDNNLCEILQVKNKYPQQIRKTFELLDKYSVKTYVHTILTSMNDSVGDMKSVYDFLSNFSNIGYWRPDLVGPSLYLDRNSFDKIKIKDDKLKLIIDFFDGIKDKSKFEIRADGIGISNKNVEETPFEEKQENFFSRGLCTANYSKLFILPDGQVTGCEELYWHPQFVYGNVITQSLKEIWNSDEAEYLLNIPQQDIGHDSICRNCNDYNKCREIKQICWRDTMKAYGEDKWYYPDVNCPKAPPKIYELN